MSHIFSTEAEVVAYFAGCRDIARKSVSWKQVGRYEWETAPMIGKQSEHEFMSDIDFRERHALADLRVEKKEGRKRSLRPYGDDRDHGQVEVLAL